jgi:hypothetical protein
MLKEQQITAFSPEACLYRWSMRAYVDNLFAKRYAMVRMADGSKRQTSRKEKSQYDFEARQLWRTVIVDANKL